MYASREVRAREVNFVAPHRMHTYAHCSLYCFVLILVVIFVYGVSEEQRLSNSLCISSCPASSRACHFNLLLLLVLQVPRCASTEKSGVQKVL